MKRNIITFSLLLSIFALFPTFAQASANTDIIEKLENSLYGFTYSSDTESSRLDRLENSVYGTVSSKSNSERISKLKQDMAADLIGQEIEPKEDTFAEAEDTYYEREPVAASNVEYPAVDELEEMVFNKVNKGDIKKRLSQLELKTFGKEYNDDLCTRTDRLKAEIKPKSLLENRLAQSSNEFYDDYVPPLGADYHLNKYQTHDMFDYDSFNARQNAMADAYNNRTPYTPPAPKQYNLSTVEKAVFRQIYKNDPTDARLTRLEQAMFGTNFANDDNETRLNRISSAYKAQKSATKYDSNKFSQNVTTAVQIGTLLLMVLACIL